MRYGKLIMAQFKRFTLQNAAARDRIDAIGCDRVHHSLTYIK